MFESSNESVSLLYAIVFDAGDASIEIGPRSLITAIIAFFVIVILMQFVARILWRRMTGSSQPSQNRRIGTIMDDIEEQDEGPVRQTKF